MSKTRLTNTEQKINAREVTNPVRPSVSPGGENTFVIPMPWLWLLIATVVVYIPSLSFGVTDLDDTIFIRDFGSYNDNIGNLFTSFQRGLFDAVKDPYYRPLFMDSMILNYQISDHGQNIMSYHLVNLAFHIISVLLLFRLFLELNVKVLHAFLLALVFAVHPVLSQAVAWIPGRNDTMLAIFIFAFLINSIAYSKNGTMKSLLLTGLFLLLAFFTKETSIFAAPVAFILLVFVRDQQWNDKKNLIQYGLWAGCFAIWFTARAAATVQSGIGIAQVLHDFIPRLPLIIQYLGKVMLPVNLSVFPIQEDTVIYFGIVALVLIAVLVAISKDKNLKTIAGGFVIFLLFLLPVLLVPAKLNEQSFEHRLYLPMIGILLMLSQTVLLKNKLKDKQLALCGGGLCAVLAIVNIQHQKSFEDPLTFWSSAAASSPHSAYATMMLAARLDKEDFQRSCDLFRKAYKLNPKEKYLNFYMGVMLQKKDSVKESEQYLLSEKNSSGYYECDFYLARVAMEKKDLTGAISCLEAYLKKDVNNSAAHNNLVLLYKDTNQVEKARAHVKSMQAAGMTVPKELLPLIGM